MPDLSHVALYLLVLPLLAVVGSVALGVLAIVFREPWTPEARLKAARRAADAEAAAPAGRRKRAMETA